MGRVKKMVKNIELGRVIMTEVRRVGRSRWE